MTPDALRSFLRRRPAGAVRCQLAVETALGCNAVAAWEKDEIEASLAGDSASTIDTLMFEAAQDFCDSAGENTRFLFRWIDRDDRPLATKQHKIPPTPEAERENGRPQSAHGDPIVRELLGHIAAQQKTINAGFAAHTQGMERALHMVSALLESSLKRERDAVDARPDPPARQLEATSEQREESLQRAEALKAFSSKLPELLDLGISIAADRLLSAPEKKGAVQ